jgi:hypothetical protein
MLLLPLLPLRLQRLLLRLPSARQRLLLLLLPLARLLGKARGHRCARSLPAAQAAG